MHQARAFSTGTAPQPDLTTAAPASRFSGREEGFLPVCFPISLLSSDQRDLPEEKTGCSASVAEPVDLESTETTDLDARKQQSWLTPFC